MSSILIIGIIPIYEFPYKRFLYITCIFEKDQLQYVCDNRYNLAMVANYKGVSLELFLQVLSLIYTPRFWKD